MAAFTSTLSATLRGQERRIYLDSNFVQTLSRPALATTPLISLVNYSIPSLILGQVIQQKRDGTNVRSGMRFLSSSLDSEFNGSPERGEGDLKEKQRQSL